MNQVSRHVATLLSVLQGNIDHLDWPSCEADWQPFLRLCEIHQVIPFVFCELKKMDGPAPAGLVELLRRRFYEISARNYHLAQQASDLATLLQANDIPVVMYKGAVAASVIYGDLALRQYQDVDVVVHYRDVLKTVDLLVRHGFEIAQYWPPSGKRNRLSRDHEVTLASPDKSYFVDVHWRLSSQRKRAFCPDMEQMWERVESMPLLKGYVLRFCREDLFLALCCHGTWHRWGRLKWLLDIAEMLRSPSDLEWDRVEMVTHDRPLARLSVSLAVMLASDLLHAPVPARQFEVLKVTDRTRTVGSAIRTEILTLGQTVGIDREHGTIAELEGGLAAWINYLWARYPNWFFEHAIARIDPKDRALLPLPQQLDFLYHMVRPIRLLGKHGTRLVQRALPSIH